MKKLHSFQNFILEKTTKLENNTHQHSKHQNKMLEILL
jgi:hypothetical protein